MGGIVRGIEDMLIKESLSFGFDVDEPFTGKAFGEVC